MKTDLIKTIKAKAPKSNFIIITCFYINVLLVICSCTFYAGATKKNEENKRIKEAAAQVFDFPEIKKEETPKTLPKKKQKARQS
jgi:hypothetical protein